jgi:hypothetical protein
MEQKVRRRTPAPRDDTTSDTVSDTVGAGALSAARGTAAAAEKAHQRRTSRPSFRTTFPRCAARLWVHALGDVHDRTPEGDAGQMTSVFAIVGDARRVQLEKSRARPPTV